MQQLKKLNIYFLAILSLIIVSCNNDDDEETALIGNWKEMSYFDGVSRSDAVSFVINGKGYVCTGYTGTKRLNDLWEYDPEKDSWRQKAVLPGVARNSAVAFSIGSKGYVGTGYDGKNMLKDFWEYDQTTDTWKQIADFGGSARYAAVALSLNNKGYVGTGYDDNYLKDFWEYNPTTNAWTQKTSVGGSKRRDAVAFTINNKGYICTGINNGTYEYNFWEYDPDTDTWTKKRDISNTNDDHDYDDLYTSITGICKTSFTINNRAYVLTGGTGSVGSIVWEYEPITDLWEQKTSLEGSARTDAVSFAIGNVGYVTTGRSSSYYFDDCWLFEPEAEYVEKD